MFLLDTNVISEYRKQARANAGVTDLFRRHTPDDFYLCVQVVGEIQAGIQKLRDAGAASKAQIYKDWLENELLLNFAGRILPFDVDAARMWGKLNARVVKDPHTADRQIAAIALLHVEMTIVTRDVHSPGFQSALPYGLQLLNPFS